MPTIVTQEITKTLTNANSPFTYLQENGCKSVDIESDQDNPSNISVVGTGKLITSGGMVDSDAIVIKPGCSKTWVRSPSVGNLIITIPAGCTVYLMCSQS